MPKRVLDTNVLIRHWARKAKGRRIQSVTTADALAWAEELIQLQNTSDIVTPVAVEFLAGQGSAHEVKLAKAFLSRFSAVDRQKIPDSDWLETIRIAQRVPPDGLRRQLGDCLIRSICNRLNYDVLTFERRFPG